MTQLHHPPTALSQSPELRPATMLRADEPGSRNGILLLHVEEEGGRLVPGRKVLAVPVHIGQAGLHAALYASTLEFRCTQTICLGAVMLDLSPELLREVGSALRAFVGCVDPDEPGSVPAAG